MAGLGTLNEVRRQWSIDDLFDAIDLLELKERAEAEAMARAQKGGRGMP